MAGKSGSAIRKSTFKGVSLILLSACLWYSVHQATQRSIPSPVADLRETVFRFCPTWLQACKRRATWFETRGYLPLVKRLDASQAKSSCPLACAVKQERSLCHCLIPRADTRNSTRGYSSPLFPFNILPSRVETSCQGYSGYALERCQTDVRTRTQLFIALTVIFSLVLFSTLLICILGCIRRVKARRRVSPAVPAKKKPCGRTGAMLPGSKARSDRRHGCGPHCIRSLSPQLNEDEAVEAEDPGVAGQDIPVTVDGMTDGWMQWIRQRANMQNLPSNSSPKPAPGAPPDLNRPIRGATSTPRIPSLKLPKPTLSTFRKVGGLGPGVTKPSSQRMKGSERSKRKETLRVRWDGTV